MGSAPELREDNPRCPMCGKADVVPTRQRKWWDWFFRQASKFPWVCRACENRFYVKRH